MKIEEGRIGDLVNNNNNNRMDGLLGFIVGIAENGEKEPLFKVQWQSGHLSNIHPFHLTLINICNKNTTKNNKISFCGPKDSKLEKEIEENSFLVKFGISLHILCLIRSSNCYHDFDILGLEEQKQRLLSHGYLKLLHGNRKPFYVLTHKGRVVVDEVDRLLQDMPEPTQKYPYN